MGPRIVIGKNMILLFSATFTSPIVHDEMLKYFCNYTRVVVRSMVVVHGVVE